MFPTQPDEERSPRPNLSRLGFDAWTTGYETRARAGSTAARRSAVVVRSAVLDGGVDGCPVPLPERRKAVLVPQIPEEIVRAALARLDASTRRFREVAVREAVRPLVCFGGRSDAAFVGQAVGEGPLLSTGSSSTTRTTSSRARSAVSRYRNRSGGVVAVDHIEEPSVTGPSRYLSRRYRSGSYRPA